MRKYIPLISALSEGENPVVDLSYSDKKIALKYRFPGFYISKDKYKADEDEYEFDQINMSKVGFLSEGGKPLLPSFGRYLQIPFFFDYSYEVKKRCIVEVDEDITVIPSQASLTDDAEKITSFEYNKCFYKSNCDYPDKMENIKGPYNIDGYCALLVHVTPFQFNPAQKKLIGYGEVDIIINITSKDSEERLDFNVDPDLNREAFGNFFLNPERNICVRFNVTPVNWQRATGPEFLIIYPIIFKTQAEKLAKWKNQKGIRTKTVLIDSIGNNYYKIRDYIRKQRRKKSRLQYILILGDIELIASLDLNTENYRTRPCSRIPDYYFSTERDPKESKDVVLPVLTIGRLPVKKDDECETVVKQIIKYENDPPSEPDYYKRMVFAAYFQDFDEKENQNPDGKACRAYIKTMESIRDHMVKLGYRVERIYVSQTTDIKHYIDGTEVPSEVVCSIVDDDKAKKYLENAFEKGYLIIAHRDHGIPEGWSNPQFQKTDLKNLNCRFPSILYSINCHSGVFNWDCNLDSTKYDSFAEAILKKGGTTPSLIAANREAGTWLGNYFVKGLFDAIWGGILPTFGLSTDNCPLKYKRLGDIQNYAKTYLPLRFRGRSEDIRKLCFEAFHVIGDPTLELWTKEPRKNQIKIRLEGFNLHIKLSYCPINSVLTIWHKEERIKRIEPSSTSLTISLQNIFKDDKVKPDISVCFSAPGWRFKEVKPEAIDE